MKYKEPKIAAPLPFDGKRENTESFLNSCSLYISARPSEFPSEDSKMHWIMSYMQNGSARLWRDYIMAQVRNGVKQFLNANDLMNEIESKFGEEDKRTTMSLKIRTMQQGESMPMSMFRSSKEQRSKPDTRVIPSSSNSRGHLMLA